MNIATIIREFRKNINLGGHDKELYKTYKNYLNFSELDLIQNEELRFKIIMHYILNKDKTIFKFVNGLSDDLFDFDRYEKYRIYRQSNKTDSSSETFFKLKFGENWKEFQLKSKNIRFNIYNINDYVQYRGYLIEDAIKTVDELKKKTAPSLEKYIEKYGIDDGTNKFSKICRRHKNYIEYWDNLYPDNPQKANEEFKKYTTSCSLKHINYYVSRGYSEEDARILISKHQLETAGVHRSYYIKLGLNNNDIDKILESINKKKDSSSINYIASKSNDLSLDELILKYEQYNMSKSSSFRQNGYLKKDDPLLDKRIAYYSAVDYYTSHSMKRMTYNQERGRYKDQYHLDHKYSKKQGFDDNINPRIIGHVVNLEWILSSINCSKRANCSITKEELLKEFNQYENQINSKA